ncbi:RHS repeat-associated protein [Clostridium punense]|uniref:RHS repeat-associated protein n=1 Tax=Clostridium punense TaxID=1054297 RepID=A0ABS4K919_9CLOT|nr:MULTISPECIES: RHS repeat-associated core domain-containing protein [Clostridium]EQB89004.1 hypothetical protein M918_22280 [Clostridium sp. BL8]MBP2024275.1 RHS repeat-associated protein [Clostridium punense]
MIAVINRNAQSDIIIGLIDKAGTQVVSYIYDSWGKLISIEGTLKDTVGVKNLYRYRGYRYDSETELYYLQSRYYNPTWGRFINADALIGQTGELLVHNMFAYTKNNPVNMSDKNGFRPVYTVGEETDAMRENSYTVMNTAKRNTGNSINSSSDSSFNYKASTIKGTLSGAIDEIGSAVAVVLIKEKKYGRNLEH